MLMTAILLLLILLLGAALRFVGTDWDEGHLLHPDERFLSWVAADLQPVGSLSEYFDTLNSPLNPNNVGHAFYVYGDWPVILLRYAGEQLGKTSLYSIYLVGRVLSTLADLTTIIVVFFLGRHLFDRRAGLLAAALYAFCAFPIQQSHFFTVDTFTNLFVVASMFFAARALTAHRWIDYPLFGLMLGLAVSSKVSVFPLAVILILALVLRVWRERQSMPLTQPGDTTPPDASDRPALKPLVLRAAVGLVIAGLVTILTFRVGQPYAFLPPNSDYPILSDSDPAPADMPGIQTVTPGLAAISRILNPTGFRPNPLWLDQMAEVRQMVSGYSDIPPNHQWGKRLPLVFPWTNMVRIGMGWPLGLWGWFAFGWAIWEIIRGNRRSAQLLLLVVWITLYFTWQGVGWVKTMRYFLPVYAFLIILGAWAIWTVWDRVQALLVERGAPRWHWSAQAAAGLGALVLISAFLWGFAVSRIYTRPVTRIAASEWMVRTVPSDITMTLTTPEGQDTYQLGLLNNWPPAIPAEDEDPRQPPIAFSYVSEGLPQPFQFSVPFSGSLTGMRFTHIVAATDLKDQATLRVAISTTPDETGILAETTITSDFGAGDDPRGKSYEVNFSPIPLEAEQIYWLILQPYPGANLVLSGSTVADEGQWDDPVPVNTPPYLIWEAQFQGYSLQMAWPDGEDKRARLQYILDRTDYLTISSNRFYDSLRRNPHRFPLSIAYYRALFSGELGFELVGDFTSRPNLGPIEFFDDNADEAWTVYDHPRVLIFRKTEAYDPARTAEILGAVDLTTVENVIAKDARGWPVELPNPEMKSSAAPVETGDVSGSNTTQPGIYRRFQPLPVIVWYAFIALIGWITFPLLYVMLPGLPDRGYGISRMLGLLFGAWLAWMLASLEIVLWSGVSIAVSFLILAVAAAAIVFPHRSDFIRWLRQERSHLIRVEALFAAMFLFFLLVRLGNPDLWHPAYGGEKPMDLSYLNAVLNSRTFPPYDPWFAGGQINYYYFGFVIVGAPIKVLGIPVTLVYNLVLPTLFAITGMSAFSAAYNLIASVPGGPPDHDVSEPDPSAPPAPTFWQTLQAWPQVSLAEVLDAVARALNPSPTSRRGWAYLAGLAALLLAVVLGNLDEIRTVVWGIAELGAGSQGWVNTYFPDLSNFARGLEILLTTDQLLPVGIGEWYWNATRIIPVPLSPDGLVQLEVQPITEFPYFTFLYADLHAHMIAMPLTLVVINWCIAQIRTASQIDAPPSPRWHGLVGGFIGALAIGALRPTNTWDWPTYLALGMGALALTHVARRGDRAALPALGIGAALAIATALVALSLNSPLDQPGGQALSQPTLLLVGGAAAAALFIGYTLGLIIFRTRDAAEAASVDTLRLVHSWGTLGGVALQTAALAAASALLFLPFIQNYRAAYSSAIPWTGSKTALWAYLDIHGLFLFVIVSWLVWETAQWRRAAREAGWKVSRQLFLASLLGAVILLAAIALIGALGIPVALITLPLIVWALALFLRPDQTIEKRAVLTMLILALALSLVVELVVLQGDLGRMNTVFKFYLQVWMLLAVVAGAAFGWLWPGLAGAPALLRRSWLGGLTVLVFLAAMYPLLATRAKVADRWIDDVPLTLDGMAYMQYAQQGENGVVFSLAPDYNALRWLQDNVKGTPVILEGQSAHEYLWGSRVAVYTGLPSVIGWRWHQIQQRPEESEDLEVDRRIVDVAEAYNTTDAARTMEILRHYQVNLIIVGDLERAYYTAEGLDKFDRMVEQGMLRLIYDHSGTRVYQVLPPREATS